MRAFHPAHFRGSGVAAGAVVYQGRDQGFDEALARAYDYRTGMSLIGLRLGLARCEVDGGEDSAGWLRPAFS